MMMRTDPQLKCTKTSHDLMPRVLVLSEPVRYSLQRLDDLGLFVPDVPVQIIVISWSCGESGLSC